MHYSLYPIWAIAKVWISILSISEYWRFGMVTKLVTWSSRDRSHDILTLISVSRDWGLFVVPKTLSIRVPAMANSRGLIRVTTHFYTNLVNRKLTSGKRFHAVNYNINKTCKMYVIARSLHLNIHGWNTSFRCWSNWKGRFQHWFSHFWNYFSLFRTFFRFTRCNCRCWFIWRAIDFIFNVKTLNSILQFAVWKP